MPIPPSKYSREERVAIRKKLLHAVIRIPDRLSNPSAERPWLVTERRFNGVGRITRNYAAYKTREDAINGISEAISAAESFASAHNAKRVREEIIDGTLYHSYLFKDPCDLMGFGFVLSNANDDSSFRENCTID